MYSSLRVQTEPAVEPVTLAEMKQHLRVDADDQDDVISGFIVSARMLVEQWTSRALITQTLLWTMSQDPPTGALPLLPMPLLVLPVILSAPQVMNKPLELPRSPVQSVTSISETDTDGTVNTLSASDYVLDLALDPARIRLDWLTVPRFLQHIQVVFVAGFGSAGADVPMPLRQAIKILVAYFFERRGDDGGEMPNKALDYLLAPYRVMYFGG